MANEFKAVSLQELKIRYENVLKNVANMLDRNGPIYSTWIEFQMGLDDSNTVRFSTSSSDKRENLIASLNVTKSCGGMANEFTLVIQYDPFNFGQDTDLRGNIEKLDSFIAMAMSEGFLSGTQQLRCKIRYGYNSFASYIDDDLVSPRYSLFLTGATSNVSFDSGITTYTFTGVSELSVDCDFITNFKGVKEEQHLLEIVGRILYQYYGSIEKKPSFITDDSITPVSGEVSYYIDISNDDIADSVMITTDGTTATQSPWNYCQMLLESNPLTISELDNGAYETTDTNVISINKRPRYSMTISDIDGRETIHVTHIEPSKVTINGKDQENKALSLDYEFSWGARDEKSSNKNIVTGWRPEVNLYDYLIRSANSIRYKKLQELAKTSKEYEEIYKSYAGYSDEVVEMYNAELEIIGVPADPPFGAEIRVLPRILESFSRTQGIYIITGASDEISNNGVFRSKLKLFRKGSIDVNNDVAKKSNINDDIIKNLAKQAEKLIPYSYPLNPFR